MKDYLDQHPEIASVRTVAADLNAQPRGKRVARRYADKVITEGTRFPYSVMNLDIWGEDIDDSPLVFRAGDPDGVLMPTERGFLPMPWLTSPTALLPIWMFHEDGAPYDGDPRQALARVVERYKARGLTPVVATELEFYLIDDKGAAPRVPPSPRSGKRRHQAEILALRQLDAWDQFFTRLYEACEAMDIPSDTTISEAGPGQFEINLMHQADALKAADDAWLFKLLVKGLARQFGVAASFMAKPYADYAGSGLHAHFSILDADGENIFDERRPGGEARLGHAIAGCLAAMPGSMLIFAPHSTSYDRFVPGAHAPTGIAWAHENRTTALRVPSGGAAARRIEHRVAGGDINPYLFLAAILGAALNGLEDETPAQPPITGNAYSQNLPQLPSTWETAITAFDRSPEIRRIFTPTLAENFLATKRQELHYMAQLSNDERIELYLDTV
ncbi:glutamine synthetase family protein [Roseibacterium sp. SDUM158017]|uniref:glutamine synthetase family protein n=1 Tax=Roseicyclus salinarum TaxID=3036773 RepID=UPI002414E3C5|nr:glutamine synthetase family protein [Roseibacterium sp. SDUM158017]MDG4649122.1 glutamine synthetase family protein [Roseibacterium sp. SDUM158017]